MKKEADKKGFAPVGELTMYYEIYGSGGTPLVLIHGGGSTIQTTFGNVLHLFSLGRQLIAVELQGHGHTPDLNRPVSFDQDADDVAALLKYLKINKADLFGFSNGGNTAMKVAMRNPEVVNKLIIASSFYQRDGFITGFFDGMQHASLESMPAKLKTAYLEVAPHKNNLQTMHDKDKARMLEFKDWTDEDLRSIKAPALIINGDHDVVTTEHAVKMSRLIPRAELMILPGTHGSYIGEIESVKEGSKIPQLAVEAIEEFLNK